MPSFLLLEDGVSRVLLEDGTSRLLLEEGGSAFEEDDWFDFSQRVGTIIRAGATLALSTSVAIAGTFRVPDDIVPQPAAAPYGSSQPANLRAQANTTFTRFYAQDELPVAPAAALEEPEWRPPPPKPPAPIIQLVWHDDNVLSQPLDEQYNWTPQLPPRVTYSLPDFQNDELPSTPATPLEEEYWWQPWRASQAPFGLPLAANDELPVVLLTPVEEDYWWQAKPQSTAASLFLPLTQDELPVTPTALIYEEGVATFTVSKDSATYIFWATNEEIVPQPASLSVDEVYDWRPYSLAEPPWTWAFQDTDDIVPQLDAPVSGVGGGSSSNLRTLSETKLFYFWQQDDLPIAAAPSLADEPEVWSFRPQAAKPFVTLWQDDLQPVPQPYAVDEDGFAPPAPSVGSPTYIIWATNEDIVPQSQLAISEDYWLAPQPRIPTPVLALWQQQDEVTTAPTPLAADEDYWLRFPAVPPTSTRAVEADDDIVPAAPPPAPAPQQGFGGGGGGRFHDYYPSRRKSDRDFIEELFARVDDAPEEVVEEALEVLQRAPSPEAVAQLVHVLLPNLEPPDTGLASRLSDIRRALEARLLELEAEEEEVVIRLLFD